MYCCAMRHLSMCYLLVLAVITSGAFFVEPLCTKRKRIFNPPLSLHLSFFLSFELSILPSFKYHVFSHLFFLLFPLIPLSYSSPHRFSPSLPSTPFTSSLLPSSLLSILFCPLPDCPLYSNLYFFSLLALLFHLFSSHAFYSTEILSLCNLVLHGLSEF